MKILSIGTVKEKHHLNITSIKESELSQHLEINHYDYIIIHGGDGTIRRVIKTLHTMAPHKASFILNPTGSFNVIAKLHRVPSLKKVLEGLKNNKIPQIEPHLYYSLNQEIFLFSAGNMGDLQHIFLSETLRFGFITRGMFKYMLAFLFLLPIHLIMTPIMLLSSQKFFIFTPFSFIPKIGTFYGKIDKEITINLKNHYNLIELDGDVVTIEEDILQIKKESTIDIVTSI